MRHKLLIVMAITSLVAVFAALLSFVVYDQVTLTPSDDRENRIALYLLALTVLTAFCGATTLLLADRLQRVISEPLVKLADTARLVSQSHDFTLRVPVTSRDEIGSLTQAFNDMLDQLQHTQSEREMEIHERQNAQQQLRDSEDTLRRLAFYDQLTGLPNRALFDDRLELALMQAQRTNRYVGVMFIDVDRFKLINDSLGHSAGDELLRGVSERMRGALRRSDTLARLGGDEFIVLLPSLADTADAATVAQKILRSISIPFAIAQQDWYATVSIGISLFPNDGPDAETLIKNADIAMYRAKDRGRDGYEMYTPELQERAMRRVQLENELRMALSRGEFVVHYQPLVDLKDSEIIGAEALLRWQHPTRGLLQPAEFIPVAEETGLIIPIGQWVLRTASLAAKGWNDATGRKLRIAVNLATRQFQHPDLVEQVTTILSETGLDANLLELEITEHSAMDDSEQTAETLRELKKLGVRLSIDDFGIGYSSLGTLKRFPLDSLKIDRAFVKDLGIDTRDAALVQAIVAIGQALQVQITAEGVETKEQSRILKQQGCDSFQGFLFSKPIPAADFTKLL